MLLEYRVTGKVTGSAIRGPLRRPMEDNPTLVPDRAPVDLLNSDQGSLEI
jgi:hypothetical protein